MSRIFISHSSNDNAKALALRDWLADQGWDDVFLDLDPERGLKAGERWQDALKRASSVCELVIFLISPAWARSQWCLAEFLLAKQLNKRIYGVFIEPTEADLLPVELSSEWQLADLTKGQEGYRRSVAPKPGEAAVSVAFAADGLERLRFGLQDADLDASYFAWPPEYDSNRPPYRGLKPIEAEDAGIFFGRNGPIVEVMDRLRSVSETAPPRFMVILGASGAGKSSFMRAGVLPRLDRDRRRYLLLPVVRPGQAALSGDDGLIACIEQGLRTAGKRFTRADIRQVMETGSEAVAKLLQPLTASVDDDLSKRQMILPIDQGEELFFTEGYNEAETFLALVRELLDRDDPPITVLVTIRSDSYERLQTAEILAGVPQHTFSLPPMPQGAYGEVILGPATRTRGTSHPLDIEGQLVDSLLSDIEAGSAKDGLPLLAFALERLFRDYGGDGNLTLADYEAMGGIRGAIGAAVEQALQVADTNPAIPKEHTARLALLKRGLIPWLAGIDPETGAPRRRVARLFEIPPEARPLIELLVEQRLLATDRSEETGEVTIEPAHEALLRQWPLLEGWLEEDMEDLSTAEGIKRAARDWLANAQHVEWLTHTGGRLELAERVIGRKDFANVFQAGERAYLSSAREQEEALKANIAERERIHQERIREAESRTERLAKRKAEVERSYYASLIADQLVQRQEHAGALAIMCDVIPPDLMQSNHSYDERALASLSRAVGSALGEKGILRGHAKTIHSATFSPNGSMVVTSSTDGTSRIWNAKNGKFLSQLKGGECICFTPNGKFVLTLENSELLIWDSLTFRLTQAIELRSQNNNPFDLVMSPRGDQVITSELFFGAQIWNLEDGQNLREFENATAVAYSPDGKKVAIGDYGSVILWDTHGCNQPSKIECDMSWVRSVDFSLDGNYLLTTSDDGSGRLWRYDDCALIQTYKDDKKWTGSGRILNNSNTIILQDHDTAENISVWDLEKGKVLWTYGRENQNLIKALVDDNGGAICLFFSDGSSTCHNLSNGDIKFEYDLGAESLNYVEPSPNNEKIIAASSDGIVRHLSVSDGQILNEFSNHSGPVRFASISPDGSLILTASEEKSVRLWHAEDARPLHWFLAPEEIKRAFNHIAVAQDGSCVAAGGGDGVIRIWSLKSGKFLESFPGGVGPIYSLKISPGGDFVNVSYADGTARRWRTKSNTISDTSGSLFSNIFEKLLGQSLPKGKFVEFDARKYGYELSWFFHDGSKVLGTANDGRAGIWQIGTNKALLEEQLSGNLFVPVKFSPDDRSIILSAKNDLSLVYRFPENIDEYHELTTSYELGCKYGAQFSFDGYYIIGISKNDKPAIWSASNGNLIHCFEDNVGQQGPIVSSSSNVVSFSCVEEIIIDVDSRKIVQKLSNVSVVAISPDGTNFLTYDMQKTISLQTVGSDLVRQEIPIRDGTVFRGATYLPNGKGVLIVSENKDGHQFMSYWNLSPHQDQTLVNLANRLVGPTESVDSYGMR